MENSHSCHGWFVRISRSPDRSRIDSCQPWTHQGHLPNTAHKINQKQNKTTNHNNNQQITTIMAPSKTHPTDEMDMIVAGDKVPTAYAQPTISSPPLSTSSTPSYTKAASNYVPINTRHPVVLDYCPRCATQNAQTKVHHKYTGATVAFIVGGLVVFWPFMFVPMCSKQFKQTNHHCSSCGQKIGRVKVLH